MNNDILASIAEQRRMGMAPPPPQGPQQVHVYNDPHQEERMLRGIGELLSKVVDDLSGNLRKSEARVMNFPSTQEVSGTVDVSGFDEAVSILRSMADREVSEKEDDGSENVRHESLISAVRELKAAVSSLDMRPQVSVRAPEAPAVNLSPLTIQLSSVNDKLRELVGLMRKEEPEPEEERPEPLLLRSVIEKTRDGYLDKVTEYWSDGSVRTATGWVTGDIRIVYDQPDS